MKWLRQLVTYIVPRVILDTSSPINAHIRVLEESGEYKLLVNGSRESGRYIRELWQYAINMLGVAELVRVNHILVLGVAGGTVIHLFHNMFPQAQLTGVDIDQTMIDIGKKYFDLGALPLQLVTADAADFIAHQKGKRYDLIVVDLFIGREIPDFVRDQRFLQKISTLLRPGGGVFINFLREKEYGKRASDLDKTLRKIWKHVASADRFNNRFFFAQ